MSQARKSRSVQATSDGQQKLRQAKVAKRNQKNKPWTFPDIAKAAALDEKTVKTFFSGKPVDKGSALAIAQALDLQLTDVVDADELEPPTANSHSEQKLLIHRQVCQGMLAEKRRLTTNPLTTGDGTTFERGDVYVPLGLVERKRQAKRTGDDSPEQGSKLYEPTEYEVTRRFEHDEFFEQVLRQGLSPKSRGKRIAIIGEPGAGKTTLLQQIADWVFEDTDQDVAIWVSLADLQGRTLEEYLLSVWLKDALKRARVTPEMEDSLVELFNRGRVWLLLDGVDEMTVEASGNAPLQAIAKQLTTGWVSSARVVLTCRLNIWDAGKNALERFDTYRTLEFSYGNGKKPDSDQVNQFISKWFEPSDPQLGKALRTALDQRGKERIKDLVKNPLRLALMCYSWQRRQGELPKTKATLYQRFVEVFYEWKQEYFPTTSATRQELNQALGRLAVEAIAQSASRFRLTRRFVSSVLGEPDAPMFQLAIQLGWLNQVGVAAEDPDEPVYAFYHPTFQEYFAALAIDDWHCFLNHIPGNPDLGIYRVFEPQWKEVILLWLGREDVPKQDKEEFIKELVEFKSGGEKFYCYRAYFLAAAGIAEFRDCNRANEIMDRLVKWSARIYLNEEKQEWVTAIYDEIAEVAMDVLKETERERAIAAFVQVIQIAVYEETRAKAALNLWQIDPGNEAALVELIKAAADEEPGFTQPATEVLELISTVSETAIAAIVELIQTIDCNCETVWQAADFLGKFAPRNEAAIAALVEQIQNKDDDESHRAAAECLGIVDPGNEIAIATLVKQIQIPEDESCRSQALLSSSNYINILGIEFGVSLDILNTYSEHKRYLRAARSLGEIGRGNEKAIAALEQLVQTAQDEYRRTQALLRNCWEETSELDKCNLYSLQECCLVAAKSLGYIDPGNQIAITALINLIETFEDEIVVLDILIEAAKYLGTIEPGNQIALAFLVKMIQLIKEKDIYRLVPGIWEEIGMGNKTAITALVQLIKTTKDKSTLWQAATILGRISPRNETAITALAELIETTEDESILMQAAESLGTIDPGNKTAIAALVKLSQDGWMEAAESLWEIDFGNQTAITALVKLIQTTESNYIRLAAAGILEEMDKNNKNVIVALVELSLIFKDESPRGNTLHYLQHILQGVQFVEVVTAFKDYLKGEEDYLKDERDGSFSYSSAFHIRQAIWRCAQNMSYPDFSRAWYSEPSSV